MNLYRVYPEPGQVDATAPESAPTLDSWFAPPSPRTVRWALVATPQGDTRDLEGGSAGLSNPVDRAILRQLRAQADAVVVSAATLRAEVVPIPDAATLVVLSRYGDLSQHRVSPASFRPGGIVIVTGAEPHGDPRQHFPPGVSSHLVVGSPDGIEAGALLAELRTRGLESILLETGTDATAAFLDASLVDELVLTLTASPRSEGHPPLGWWREQWGQWSASAVFTDDERYLYTRYHREPQAA